MFSGHHAIEGKLPPIREYMLKSLFTFTEFIHRKHHAIHKLTSKGNETLEKSVVII